MSSEMRELIDSMERDAVDIRLGRQWVSACEHYLPKLRALLARTEAGADGAIDSRAAFERWAKPQGYRMHIRDTPGSARLGQYGDDSTQAAWEAWTASRTTRPQDARGDAELFEACYGAMRDAMACIDADDGPGRRNGSALTKLAACRVSIERRTSAMQAKEAK